MNSLSQIATQIPGYDPNGLTAQAAQAVLAQWVEPITDTEDVSLFAALGRVLARDVVSPLNVPPHDNSAMDGYAFDGAPLRAGAPLTLRCIATVLAGAVWRGPVGPGECVKIMTGAAMPPGLNTVVPHEIATRDGEHIHIAADTLRPGANRRLKGEDLTQGCVALAQGAPLTPAALGLLASLGLAQVPVVRRLRVAYFSTGDEILSLGEPPRDGAVYDSNRYTILGLLTRLGAEVIDMGVVPDQLPALEAAFRSAAQQADAIVTSGGISMGEADHTRAMMAQLGDVAFWRIAMRPGRPLAVGTIARASAPENTCTKMAYSADEMDATRSHNKSVPPLRGSAMLLGLPGNPVAAMVSFLAFVRPALLRMMGSTQTEPPRLRAVCTEAIRKRPGRTEYQRGWVSTAPNGTLQVRSTGQQGSGMLSSMVQANGLIVLDHARGTVAAGETVEVMLFDGVV